MISGDSHLITSSLTLATRFLEAAQGIGSLATTPGFRYARREMPLDRDDTIFLYLPTEFFQNLLGPAYQIELRRRNQSIADMQLIELAYLAARAEGIEADNPAPLIANRFCRRVLVNGPMAANWHAKAISGLIRFGEDVGFSHRLAIWKSPKSRQPRLPISNGSGRFILRNYPVSIRCFLRSTVPAGRQH